MKNVTNSFVFLAHWPFAGSFGLNTDILATNLINLTVVVGVLIFFGFKLTILRPHFITFLSNNILTFATSKNLFSVSLLKLKSLCQLHLSFSYLACFQQRSISALKVGVTFATCTFCHPFPAIPPTPKLLFRLLSPSPAHTLPPLTHHSIHSASTTFFQYRK